MSLAVRSVSSYSGVVLTGGAEFPTRFIVDVCWLSQWQSLKSATIVFVLQCELELELELGESRSALLDGTQVWRAGECLWFGLSAAANARGEGCCRHQEGVAAGGRGSVSCTNHLCSEAETQDIKIDLNCSVMLWAEAPAR